MPRLASLILGMVVIALLVSLGGLGWLGRATPTSNAINATNSAGIAGTTDTARTAGSPHAPQEPPKFAQDRIPRPAGPKMKAIPFDGDRAHKYLKQLCEIGPRISGSEGMIRQRQLIIKHFEQLGGQITRQEFEATQKSQRKPVALVNIVARWHPDRPRRILLCAHYDTRPMADQEDDPTRWNKPFLSANDGTSGVAFLMELAHHLPDLPTKFGIDIVLFDAEEYIFNPGTTDGQGDQYFLGSEHFAREYVRNRRAHTWQYEAAVLFDLFAAEDARLAVEGYSLAVAPHIVQEIWTIAAQLKAKSFTFDRGFQRSYMVLDDHVPLQRAGIPAIDIIDFDYPHWHKLSDTPEQVCPRQMEEVARVITTWLQQKE